MVHGAETCRTDGYGVLRTTQEAEPGVIPARLSSHDYGCVHLGLSQIFARRPRSFSRNPQLVRAHHHVHVLPDSGHGTPLPQVPLVEEVHDDHPVDAVRHHAGLSVSHHQLPVQRAPIADVLLRDQRYDIPVPVLELLSEGVQQGGKENGLMAEGEE